LISFFFHTQTSAFANNPSGYLGVARFLNVLLTMVGNGTRLETSALNLD